MNSPGSWKYRALLELQQAEAARAVGNEGRSRVCARRAAGEIAREFLQRQGIALSTPSAYDILRSLQASPIVSPQAREVAGHFLMRVDADFHLPVDADLLVEARWLAAELLGETI